MSCMSSFRKEFCAEYSFPLLVPLVACNKIRSPHMLKPILQEMRILQKVEVEPAN